MSDHFEPFSESRWSRAPGACRFDMTSEPQELGSRKNPAARLPEIDFAVVLSRAIESIEHDPAQLRYTVYEIVRIKLEKEICQTHPAINSLEARRLTLALESAIEGVETIYSKQDELRALRSLHRLIESSGFGQSEVVKPREPLLIVEQRPAQTIAHAARRISINVGSNRNHYKGYSSRASHGCQSSREGVRRSNVKRSFHWPLAAPVKRGAMVVIFAVALCAVLSQFGRLGHKAALSPPSQTVGQLRNEPALSSSQLVGQLRHQAVLSPASQSEPAPIAPPATAQIQQAPANVSRGRVADAGFPALAPSPSGRDVQVAPAEQLIKSSVPNGCRTQTYTVPSESGGQVSVNVMRC